MDVRVGLWRRLIAEELMLLNCGVGEESWESLGLQGDSTTPFWKRSALGFLWKNDAKAETRVLWPPHAKSWLIGKDSDAGRDWGQEEKGTTEDEMAGWHHWLDGCEFQWTPGVGDGQGGLVCCDSWGRKELDTTERLNWLTDTYREGLRDPPVAWTRHIYSQRDWKCYHPVIRGLDFQNDHFGEFHSTLFIPLIIHTHLLTHTNSMC